jgi:hypothetical protein
MAPHYEAANMKLLLFFPAVFCLFLDAYYILFYAISLFSDLGGRIVCPGVKAAEILRVIALDILYLQSEPCKIYT